MKSCKCGSYAINHHCHGRDGTHPDLCDVCFWRSKSDELQERIKRLEEAGDLLTRMVCRQDGYGIYQDEEDAVNSWHKAKEAKL